MKVKTIVPFIDKTVNEIRIIGAVFECTKVRYGRIRNYVEVVEEEKESTKKK